MQKERLRSFAFNILEANRTNTLSQDRYQASRSRRHQNLIALNAIQKH